MKDSTAILATIVLGIALAIGSATASMARGGMTGHGGGAFSGGHGGSDIPFILNHGNGSDGGLRIGGNHGFGHGRHFGAFRGHGDSNAFFGFAPFCSYGPASGTYVGRDRLRHYCS